MEHPPAARRRRDARRTSRHGRRRLHRTARRGGSVLAPLQQLGTPLADMTATMPYVESQAQSTTCSPTAAATTGSPLRRRDHRRTDRTPRRTRRRRPSPQSVIMIRTLGGAIGGVGDLRDCLPAPLSTLQHQRGRLVAGPRARRHRHRLGPVDLGRHRSLHRWRVHQLRPDSATTPTFVPPHWAPTRLVSKRSAVPTTPAASSAPPRTNEPRAFRSPAVAGTVAPGSRRGCRSACLVPTDPTTSRQAQ